MAKIIKAVFTGRFCKTARVFQFDAGDALQFVNLNLPENYSVDFANSKTGESKTVLASSDTVAIPPEFFVPGSEIYAWVWISDSDGGYTKCEATIPVDQRAKRTESTPTPAQQAALDAAISALNSATQNIPSEINAALTQAKESGEFDGEDGFSPTVEVDKITGGHQVIITDKEGQHQFDVMDGEGGGGTSDYSDLTNKPQINSVTLSGNKSLSDLGIAAESSVPLAANVKPKMSGEAAVGSSTKYAREDHVHPIFYPESDEVGWSGEKISHINPNTVTEAVEAVYNVIPTKTSELTNDIGFLTQHQSLAAYREATAQDVIDQQQNTAIAAKYAKPSGGIPKTDLASEVQTSLGKADTALQSVPSTYRTAADQDVIDAAQDTAIAGKLSTTGNAYRSASIPMGHLDSTSTATVMTAQVDGITELRDGVCVWLKNGVVASASGVTLNINSLGAKPIYNSLSGAIVTTTFTAASTYLFVYNSTRVTGGCWDMVYGYDANTTYTPVKLGFGYATCSTAEATAAKTATLSSYTLTTGGIVAVKFTNAVPANATLNVNSKGAKAIYYKGAAITAGVIKAGDTVTMIYSTYYHVLSIDRDVGTLPPSPSDDNPLMDSEASPGSSTDYARADHVHPSDSSKIGYDDAPYMLTMTASGSAVTCFKTFLQIYAIFYSQRKTYFILAASQTDYQLFTIDRVDGGNQTIYLSSIVGGVLSQIVLTPGGSSTMTGTLSTIDLNLQNASGVSF